MSLAKIDLVSLYFRLLWYHSILRSSIDQKHAKTHDTKFEDKTVKSTELPLVLVGLHDFQIFPDRTAYAWSVEVGNIIMFGLSLFCQSQQSNITTSGEERFKYPLPWENTVSQMPYPRANKDNQILTPFPASSPPPPPCQHNIDRCISKKIHKNNLFH